MDLEQRINNAKSKLVKDFAEKLGLPVIDIKMVESDPKDFIGKPTFNEEMDKIVEARMASKEIQPGDHVLMEIQPGVMESVFVENIEDGIVYGLGDDGEPFCAPLDSCDKVPY